MVTIVFLPASYASLYLENVAKIRFVIYSYCSAFDAGSKISVQLFTDSQLNLWRPSVRFMHTHIPASDELVIVLYSLLKYSCQGRIQDFGNCWMFPNLAVCDLCIVSIS